MPHPVPRCYNEPIVPGEEPAQGLRVWDCRHTPISLSVPWRWEPARAEREGTWSSRVGAEQSTFCALCSALFLLPLCSIAAGGGAAGPSGARKGMGTSFDAQKLGRDWGRRKRGAGVHALNFSCSSIYRDRFISQFLLGKGFHTIVQSSLTWVVNGFPKRAGGLYLLYCVPKPAVERW